MTQQPWKADRSRVTVHRVIVAAADSSTYELHTDLLWSGVVQVQILYPYGRVRLVDYGGFQGVLLGVYFAIPTQL